MDRLIRAHDWAGTCLGPIDGWSRSLKGAVATCLGSRFQMAVYWGSDLVCIYNDAEREVLGELHPRALGMPARELLRDAWSSVGPQLRAVMERAETTWSQDRALTFDRHGRVETGYFTYSYSPLYDDDDTVAGVLLVTQETTARVLAERRLALLRGLAEAGLSAADARQACALSVRALRSRDVPFALLYALEEPVQRATCLAAAGVAPELTAELSTLELTPGGGPLADACREAAAGAPDHWVDLSAEAGAGWPSDRALVAALGHRGDDSRVTVAVLGLADDLALDDGYAGFFAMARMGLYRNLTVARVRETERERSRSIEELSRARTALFHNTSHELRTPLTLILGQLGRLVDDEQLPAPARDDVAVARRSATRMLKLVSALLDVARIEAGERIGSFRATALPELTADVAAMFRSTAERAGLELVVDCPPLPDPIVVDPEAWERIASNLLSNAVKFTPTGRISVATRLRDGVFSLVVEDTGIGISEDLTERIFERFARVPDARARTHEGSGIGLALVRELVTLHGGSAHAESRPSHGTRMTVSIPVRDTTSGRRGTPGPSQPFEVGEQASMFVAEADGWLVDAPADVQPAPIAPSAAATPTSEVGAGAEVLVVEDDADMRGYLSRLLASRYTVQAVRTGAEAWQSALAHRPELIISDVMMPGMDGFALLRRLRNDRRTQDLPVVLISARADPESTASALEAGADDYIAKPFGARELLARIRATLENARIRADAGEAKGRVASMEARDRELRILLNDLRAAQRRVTVAADQERQRIERDLHDGAQQRLISLRLELSMLSETLTRDPAAAAAKLAELRPALDEALEELRDLSHGVYPSLLASDGLYYALLAAARRAPVPVTVSAEQLTRAPGSIESAAYFCCLEAITNAAKHAGTDVRVRVDLSERHGLLEFHVRDDGVGFDTRHRRRGNGLINLGDRAEALGGTVRVRSTPGEGTEVIGQIPLP